MNSVLKKIVILGTTGSGKTTFLKNLVGKVDDAEVKRKVVIEEAQVLNTFTPIDKKHFEDSTTTVSFNVRNVLFATTTSNQFQFFHIEKNKVPPEFDETLDSVFPTVIIDTAGQERFQFMQEIGIKGADAAIIFADGTNIQSIERVSHYYELIMNESKTSAKTIPIVIFVNKMDLRDKGYYIGKQPLENITDDLVEVYETSNLDPETFFPGLRTLLYKITGFPVSINEIKLKSIHEVFE